jgi:hypothetical protein
MVNQFSNSIEFSDQIFAISNLYFFDDCSLSISDGIRIQCGKFSQQFIQWAFNFAFLFDRPATDICVGKIRRQTSTTSKKSTTVLESVG